MNQGLIYKNKLMRKAGTITASILKKVCTEAKVGVSLEELDKYAEELCKENNVKPAFKGYEGFPSTICVGLNDVVVHGIPNEYRLKDGDIVSIDFGAIYKSKAYGDNAYTVSVGEIDKKTNEFIETVKNSLYAAIEQAVPGKSIGDIGHAIQSTVEEKGYSVVREMTGHGIGFELHEEPFIPGYGEKGKGFELYQGQTIAIESIVNQGTAEIDFGDDGWTTTTKDGKLSVLFEHTVLVDKKPEILTISDFFG